MKSESKVGNSPGENPSQKKQVTRRNSKGNKPETNSFEQKGTCKFDNGDLSENRRRGRAKETIALMLCLWQVWPLQEGFPSTQGQESQVP